MSKNISELSGRKGLENNLFDRLGNLVMDSPQPSKDELAKLADEFLVGTANVYGATTFYDFLKPENRGKKVYICSGSVCLCAGTQEKLKDNLLEHFEEDEIGEMCCLGRCHENNAFFYQNKNYSGKQAQDINAIVDGKGNHIDKYEIQSVGTPVLTRAYAGLNDHYSALKNILGRDRDDVLNEIKNSGIRGRGGAGFPMGMKLDFAKKADGDTKFIICNADEGDPGAFSDRWLMEERPHSVLFGMIASGYVVGANWGVVYIRAEYPESVEVIENAIRELRENGFIGDRVMGSDFSFDLKVIHAQGSYICGEETALINSIEGQRPEVRVRPPYPAQEGLFRKPTVVNNVETLAALHYILTQGADAYNSLGTASSKGTKLMCLDSRFNHPGLYEVEMGTALSEVVYTHGGGFVEPVKALHIGGPLGGLVPVSKIDSLTVDFESFQDNGFLLGHASVVSIPERFPLVQYLEHLFEFASDESCGKCFPCRLGTKRAEEMLAKARKEDYRIDRNLFDDLLHTLEIGSLCAHGGGIPLPVRNALEHFDSELGDYFL
jgi:NADH-quinone oxidoreductase subunit F